LKLSSPQAVMSADKAQAGLGAGPAHVAIIMDGNGRWAKKRLLPHIAGHRKGAEAARAVVEAASQHPTVQYLTLYAFSSENWQRPPQEVQDLMQLLGFYLDREAKKLHENHVRLKVVGDVSRLERGLQDKIGAVEEETAQNTGLTLQIALSYGGRQELIHAARQLAEKVAAGVMKAESINDTTMRETLYTAGAPDPDLLIRTGGEQRISNFLLWQMAYTELYFTDCLWPDFNVEEWQKALTDYQQRERRFGRRKVA